MQNTPELSRNRHRSRNFDELALNIFAVSKSPQHSSKYASTGSVQRSNSAIGELLFEMNQLDFRHISVNENVICYLRFSYIIFTYYLRKCI